MIKINLVWANLLWFIFSLIRLFLAKTDNNNGTMHEYIYFHECWHCYKCIQDFLSYFNNIPKDFFASKTFVNRITPGVIIFLVEVGLVIIGNVSFGVIMFAT